MGESTSTGTQPPALLEQLGALGSLLIHDMANQMCIVSGNATFAQMMMHDPQQLGRAIEAISKSSERMSYILGQTAELRRRLGGELPQGDAAEALAGLRTLLAQRPGWTLDVAEGLTGRVQVPTAWVVFAVHEILRETPAAEGRARIRRASPDSDTTFLPGGAYFEVRLWWESAKAFSMEEHRAKFENFGLLAAFELVRQSGGKLEGFTPATGRQEVLLCVPFVYDIETARGGAG